MKKLKTSNDEEKVLFFVSNDEIFGLMKIHFEMVAEAWYLTAHTTWKYTIDSIFGFNIFNLASIQKN